MYNNFENNIRDICAKDHYKLCYYLYKSPDLSLTGFYMPDFIAFLYRLWLATVNTLCPAETPVPHLTPQLYTDEDIMKDPLTVLRCDRRVFR